MSTSDNELYAGFVEEVQAYLPLIRQGIAAVELNPGNGDALSEIHRLAHSIKGAAAMVGHAQLSEKAHWAEDAVEQVVNEAAPWNAEMAEALAGAVAEMESLLLNPPDLQLPDLSDFNGLDFAALSEESEASWGMSGEMAGSSADELPPEVMEAFREESEEHIQAIHEQLPQWEEKPGNKALMQSIRRSVHTLKGAAGMVGYKAVSQLAHRMEDVLDLLYEGSLAYAPEIASLLRRSFGTLEQMLHAANTEPFGPALEQLYAAYAALIAQAPAEPASESSEAAIRDAEIDEQIIELAEKSETSDDNRKSQQFVRVPITVLDDLVRLVSELVVNRSTFEQHLSRYSSTTGEMEKSLQRLGKLSNKLDTDYEVLAMQERGHQSSGKTAITSQQARPAEFDELEFDRYTEFHLLSRDLTETISDLSTAVNHLELLGGDFDHYLKRLGRLTTDVQDKLLRVRLVPLSHVIGRLQRTVRVTAEAADKRVDLAVEGENVEIDKIMLEELVGPLEHILRNCVDHGVEKSADRLARGKSERGRITVRAYHEGTQVVLEIGDDGRGIDPEVLRRAVIRLGFLSEEEAAELSREDLFECLFQPGFSTAEKVSEISGRGVGMDVVRSAVQEWKGAINLESTVGVGTKFTIRLPLTLASTRVMLVKASGETYALPLSQVVHSVHVHRDEFSEVNGRRSVQINGRSLPVSSLAERLGLPAVESTAALAPTLVLRVGERQIALVVDQFLDAREVVVKTLGGLLRKVRGVSGATLMGDGSVVLIIDPSDFAQESRTEPQPQAPKPEGRPAANKVWQILVVDDSLSVRRVLTNFVKNNGWEPAQARDGQEALELLERMDTLPDAVLLDVEMPRMTGYELLTALRSRKRFENLPVVMLTSRSSDKHRKKAFEAGANDYLVKPYNERTLVHTLRRVVKEHRASA